MAVYMFGWPLSPEAASEIFKMSFPWNREKAVLREDDFFMESPTVQKAIKCLQEGQRKRIAFKAETAASKASSLVAYCRKSLFRDSPPSNLSNPVKTVK